MSDSEDGVDIFQEPDDFYEPEKQPTFVDHHLIDGRQMRLRLVGHNPLWVGKQTRFPCSSDSRSESLCLRVSPTPCFHSLHQSSIAEQARNAQYLKEELDPWLIRQR